MNAASRRSIDPAQLSAVDRYRLLIGAVIPRPIAWITTLHDDGSVNLAPFSFFNGVTATPPTLQVCIAHRDPTKDTLRNLQRTGEAVVHLVPPEAVEAMHGSGAEYPPGRSEAAALGLSHQPARTIAGAVLDIATVAFECRLTQAIPVGTPPTHLCLLEIVLAHLDPGLGINDSPIPDAHRHQAVARLGGESYLVPQADGQWNLRDLPRVRRPPI